MVIAVAVAVAVAVNKFALNTATMERLTVRIHNYGYLAPHNG